MNRPRLSLALALFAVVAPRAAGQEASVGLLAEPVVLEPGGMAIEPMDAGLSALTPEGADEVTQISEAAAPAVPRTIRLRASVGALYDDNIYQTATDTQADTLLTLSAGFTWNPRVKDSNLLALGYTATAFRYLDDADLGNGLNHDARLDARAVWGATTFTGNFGFRHMAGADVTLAGAFGPPPPLTSSPEDRSLSPQQNRNLITLDAGFSRPLAGKSSVTGAVHYLATLYDDDLPSTDDLSGRLGLGYLVGARTTLGLSGVVGRSGGDDGVVEETYQQALVTVGYDPTEKLDFSAGAGADFRQAEGAGGDDRTDFVFNLAVRYQWREKTNLYLNAQRSSFSSVTLPGTSDLRTSLYLGVNQKIGDRWSLDLAGGYDFSDYQDPTDGYGSLRDEDFLVGRTSLNYQPGPHWFMGMYYEYRRNDSSDEIFSYEGNRFGLQLALSF